MSVLLLLGALSLLACRDPERAASGGAGSAVVAGKPSGIAAPLKYARGFTLARDAAGIRVEVKRPWQGATRGYTYRLVDRPSGDTVAPGISAARGPGGEPILAVPARRILTMTTTNLPHLEAVGALGRLVGMSGARYACNAAVRAGLASGAIRDVGEEGGVDPEAVLDLRPDLIFAFAVASSPNAALEKLAATGLPLVMEAAYLEETPLGRAEWIKFTAAFTGGASTADSLFAHVDSAYRALADLARGAARRPTVVLNAPFGGIWWMPGGRTYLARFLADAGADYIWADDTTRGALSLDLEAVLTRAGGAEVWLNPGSFRTLAEMKDRDPRHTLFRSFREGRVWTHDRRSCGAGDEFHEVGSTRPDWILADLIALLHPELLPNHVFRWYRRLEAT